MLDALTVVMLNEHRKAEWIEDDVNLEFASDRWRKLVRRSHGHGNPTNRRMLEVCVFTHLAAELRSGGICVEGSESFSDYRKQLVPWEDCKAMMPVYCQRVGIPETAHEFVDGLRALLRDTAQRLDDEFPKHAGDVVINKAGEPSVKRVTAKEVPASVIALQAAIENRVAPRNILDIHANIEHWTGFTRHFGPLSGRRAEAAQRARTLHADGLRPRVQPGAQPGSAPPVQRRDAASAVVHEPAAPGARATRQAQLGQARAQQQRMQDAFSTDLAKAREAVDAADQSATAAEKRALLEIEQERQARAKAEKQVEALRTQFTQGDALERQTNSLHSPAPEI